MSDTETDRDLNPRHARAQAERLRIERGVRIAEELADRLVDAYVDQSPEGHGGA